MLKILITIGCILSFLVVSISPTLSQEKAGWRYLSIENQRIISASDPQSGNSLAFTCFSNDNVIQYVLLIGKSYKKAYDIDRRLYNLQLGNPDTIKTATFPTAWNGRGFLNYEVSIAFDGGPTYSLGERHNIYATDRIALAITHQADGSDEKIRFIDVIKNVGTAKNSIQLNLSFLDFPMSVSFSAKGSTASVAKWKKDCSHALQ